MATLSVWAQCDKCHASMTILFYTSGNAIVSVEPDSKVKEYRHELTHACGGNLQFFTCGNNVSDYKFARSNHFGRERKRIEIRPAPLLV